MSGASNKVVCVTGASGYIASWLVKLLLQQGYTVKATLTGCVMYVPDDPKKTEHLISLDGAKERLHLFRADLLDEGSFDPAVDGCDGVFHTASPVIFSSISDPQVELIDPAVKGTLNVLKSCKKFPTVKRVVLTSSMASVIMNGKPLTPDVVVDETWYSDPLIAEKHKLWYLLSKTLAEEAAWKFAERNGIDLVSINPGFVIGPILQPEINLTVEMIKNLMTGKPVIASSYRLVGVRDVALAHIQAFEVPSASGRYCLVSHAVLVSEVLKIIRQLYPILHISERCVEEKSLLLPSDPHFQVSKEKAKGLGVGFYPLEVTLKDTIESLKEKGFLNF